MNTSTTNPSNNGHEPEPIVGQPEEPESYFMIVFKEPGSVLHQQPQVKGVTAMQLLALAGYLETKAKTMLSVEFQSNQIAVPTTQPPQVLRPGDNR